ncbi:MAG TPA: FHA domain-containing protein [Thermoanaerobaculia bacterium]|nr:FHA domain-containing protein [Thermoanaerobaculia bacterium]
MPARSEAPERLRRGLRQLRELVVRPWRRGRSLLEIRRSLVDAAAARATYVGSGRRVFPYNQVVVTLRPRDEREHAEMRAAIAAGWSDQVRSAVDERLEELGCEPEDLVVVAEVAPPPPGAEGLDAEERDTEPFELSFETTERPSPSPPSRAGVRLSLRVVRGRAEQESYTFEQERVYIGRLPEVLDEHGRVKRRNHVAFFDDGEENHTVSREQARIVYRDDPAGYWLIDERSAYGTRIFRGGRPIDVSSRDRRGIRLRDGDEVYFGQAAVVCTLVAGPRD